MVSSVNSHTNAPPWRWHLWEIDYRFAPGLPPGWFTNFSLFRRTIADRLAHKQASAPPSSSLPKSKGPKRAAVPALAAGGPLKTVSLDAQAVSLPLENARTPILNVFF